MVNSRSLISVVAPVFNEAAGIERFHSELVGQLELLKRRYQFEIVYIDDGSTDGSLGSLSKLAKDDNRVRLISLTRNFGKEIASTAGIHAAQGEAIITIDADLQHPVGLIPQLIQAWEKGSRLVVGRRLSNDSAGWAKRLGSRIFYGIYGRLFGLKLISGATDFRLIDKVVQRDFGQMTEHGRMTRGLIDWLGYTPTYVPFHASARHGGSAAYSMRKLIKLAIDSTVSLSTSPLYITAYIGAVVLPLSLLLGLLMIINALIGDPFGLNISGSGYMLVLVLCLVGILMMSQGIIGLYLSSIHTETQNRPLYVIDKKRSVRAEI